MNQSTNGQFKAVQEGEWVRFEVVSARPSLGFVAAVVVFAGLFGLPALAIFVDRTRWDLPSLLVGLLGAGIAVAAITLAFHGQGRGRFWAGPAGLRSGSDLIAREAVADLAVRMPNVQPVPTGGAFMAFGVGTGAAVAERERARRTSLVVRLSEGGATHERVLVRGFSVEVANQLLVETRKAMGMPMPGSAPAEDGR